MRGSTFSGYAAAVLLVAAAAVLEAVLWPWVQPSLSPLFAAAVTFAALYGGLRPALLATVLSVLACAFFFLPPTRSLSIGPDDALRLVVFVSVALVVSSVAAARRRAELRLAEAREAAERASRAKDRFLALCTHELRGPLSPVTLAASAIAADPAVPEWARADARMIHRNVELQARLIGDLLDTSRIASGKLELRRQRVDVHAAVRDCVAMCQPEASSKAVELAVELSAARPDVDADPARLRQVFANLLGNAVKFTPAGGGVTVRSSDGPGAWVRVEVADTGIGIPADALPRVFEPFEQGGRSTTRRFGGLGLGLAIVKGIVGAHGGSIAARSDGTNRGSTFAVDWPCAPAADAATASASGGTASSAADGGAHRAKADAFELCRQP